LGENVEVELPVKRAFTGVWSAHVAAVDEQQDFTTAAVEVAGLDAVNVEVFRIGHHPSIPVGLQ
jgi:hypothetical protein